MVVGVVGTVKVVDDSSGTVDVVVRMVDVGPGVGDGEVVSNTVVGTGVVVSNTVDGGLKLVAVGLGG